MNLQSSSEQSIARGPFGRLFGGQNYNSNGCYHCDDCDDCCPRCNTQPHSSGRTDDMGLPAGRSYYNGRYYGNFNNRFYGTQYGYF